MTPDLIFTRLKSLARGLTAGQLATLAVTFVGVVVLIIGSAYWMNAPSYRLLFSDLDAEAAAGVASRLRDQNVPYRIDEGGRAIRVPASRLDELRLDFASRGMPSAGRIGFEIFDRTAFGATEFLEQVNYRRALEGEIARTISSIAEVAGARVHIAMGKESLFSGREQAAKASVVLKLRDRQALPAGTVQGIASLVAASVDGLRPESVVVLDTHGRPLLRPNPDGEEPLGAAELERQQRYERDLSTRVIALLEPVVGPDRVRVNVSARLDAESQEQTEERWDPAGAAIRSRQVSADSRTATSARGVAGSRANLPAPVTDDASAGADPDQGDQPPAAAAPPATAAASLASPNGGTSSETTNFEISKTVRHTVRPRGNVARLSVAVILDHAITTTRDEAGATTRTSAARPPEELQKIYNLVAASVGLDPSRGDQLTVEQLAFDEPIVETIEPVWWERWVPEAMQLLRVLAVLVLGALAFFFLVRPLMKRVVSGVPAAPSHQPVMTGSFPKTIQELEGEIGAQLDAAVLQPAGERLKLPVLTKRLANMTVSEPQNAAKLIRNWLNEEAR